MTPGFQSPTILRKLDKRGSFFIRAPDGKTIIGDSFVGLYRRGKKK
jgi:hypothetical protein